MTKVIGELADLVLMQVQEIERKEKSVVGSLCKAALDRTVIQGYSTDRLEKMICVAEILDGIIICEELISRNPQNHKYHYQLAYHYRLTEDYNNAHIEIDKAIYAQKDNGQYHTEKAAIFCYEGQIKSALKAVDIAINLGHESLLLYQVNGLCYLVEDNYQKARHIFDIGFEKYPDSAELAQYLVLAMINSEEDYSVTIETVSRAIRRHPNDARLHYYKAVILAQQKNYREAYEEASLAVKNEPNEVLYDEVLGLIGALRAEGWAQ